MQGIGNLVLSGSSNHTGITSVAGGRLSVTGVLGTTPIAVLTAAELGGSGSIGGAVSIDAGGTLSPGNSIQSLATGTATFAAGATFEYEVDSTDINVLSFAADLLVVNAGLFTLGSNILAIGERFMAGSQLWEIDHNRTSAAGLANFTGGYLPTSSFVAITAVPEPSSLVLMAIGAAVTAWAARRRRCLGTGQGHG